MADQPPIRLRATQRLARNTSKRRPADRQHSSITGPDRGAQVQRHVRTFTAEGGDA